MINNQKIKIYFVGIGGIGMSGIAELKNKQKVEEKVINFLESKVLDNLEAFNRRTRLRKTVEDA